MSSKLPYKGDVNEAQRNGDRAAIRTIMAWRKRRELGQLDLEESVDDASPTTTAASSQSSSVDEGSVAPPLEATRGPSGPAEQNTTVDTERAPTGTNSTAATPKVSPAQASAVGPNDGMNSDSDDGPPPLESCSDSSSEEEPPRRNAKPAAPGAVTARDIDKVISFALGEIAGQDLDLVKGSRVRLHGLVSKPEMNGMVGVISGNMKRSTERWPVKVPEGSIFNIKATNLQVLSASNTSIPKTEITGTDNNAKKQKTAKSCAAAAAVDDGSDSEGPPSLESWSDTESDSDSNASPTKHPSATKSVGKSTAKESKVQNSKAGGLPTSRAAAVVESDSDDGPPPLQPVSDSESDNDRNSRRQSKRQTAKAKNGVSNSATTKEGSVTAKAPTKAPTSAQQRKDAERAAAYDLYKSKLSDYVSRMDVNQQQHGLRYGVGEKVRVLVLTEPGKPAAWQSAVVTGVRARANSVWPAWKTVPYLVALECDTEDDTQWVATDTDRWVQSLQLIELIEIRRKLIRDHGIANLEPIPGSPAITLA